MKTKLALRSGDIVITREKGKIINRTVTTARRAGDISGEVVIINSPLHVLIENLGLLTVNPNKKIHSVKIPGLSESYFKHIVILEIERKKKWYTSIVNKLVYLMKKR